jgi:hypothetical protein
MSYQLIKKGLVVASLLLGATTLSAGGANPGLAYPADASKLSAEEVMDNVYYVNHFFAFKNYSIERDNETITVIVKKSKGKEALTETVERYLNNDYSDGVVRSKDLAIFRSGKLKGNGMLITDYVDDSKSQEYLLWLPALRKIRRFAQPAHDDAWGGTDFTFGDVTLRKPMHETHELVGTEVFGHTLGAIVLEDGEKTKYTQDLPGPKDAYKDRQVIKIKSTTKFGSWWYDYRISYVDTITYADYRSEYYKDGKMIKFIDKDWAPLPGQTDKRALRWSFWYGKNIETGHESMAFIPEKVTRYNSPLEPELWSNKTLTKIKI